MARPPVKKPAPAAKPQPEPSDVTDAGETQENQADDLSAVMAELAGSSSSTVTVYRAVKGQNQQYVFKCSPDAFSLDTLRDTYNGGEFRLYITRDGQLWKNRTVHVEPKQASAPVPPTQAAELAAAMREGFAKQAELMAATLRTLAAPAPPPPPPLLSRIDIPAAITAVSGLLAVLRPPMPPMPAPAPGLDAGKSVDLILRGIELGREVKGDGGDGEVTLMGVVKDLLKSPLLAQAVQAATVGARPQASQPRPQPQAKPQQIPQAVQPQPVPPAASPIPGQVIDNQSFASETQTPMNQQLMTMYLPLLCAKAAEGSDSSLYADLILDSVDADTLHALLAAQPSTVDVLIGYHAGVAAHREWFEEMISTVKEALAEDVGTVAQLEGNNASHTDASAHPTPSIPGGASAG